MIVLDTNVISELMRSRPDEHVLSWFDEQAPDDLLLTAVSVAEILYGIARLPDGRKKAVVESAAREMLKVDFFDRILPFDEAAAEHYARAVAARERAGRPIGQADALIAATCISYEASLATRNVSDFDGLGLHVISPWQRGAE